MKFDRFLTPRRIYFFISEPLSKLGRSKNAFWDRLHHLRFREPLINHAARMLPSVVSFSTFLYSKKYIYYRIH
jgi:hypothetical protein